MSRHHRQAKNDLVGTPEYDDNFQCWVCFVNGTPAFGQTMQDCTAQGHRVKAHPENYCPSCGFKTHKRICPECLYDRMWYQPTLPASAAPEVPVQDARQERQRMPLPLNDIPQPKTPVPVPQLHVRLSLPGLWARV